MFLSNFKNSFSNFLAQRLQRLAEFLRQNDQAANPKKANPPEPPENISPHENWLRKTASKPPQDWVERVSRDAPQILFEMPEFTAKITEPNETAKPFAITAEIETERFQTDRRKNVRAAKEEESSQIQSKSKAASTPSLLNPANTTSSKQRFSPLKIFAPRENSNRQTEPAKDVSIASDNAADLANKSALQTDSTVIRNKSLPRNPKQTSIIQFKRREAKPINKSDSTDFKVGPNSVDNAHHRLEQTDNHPPIKFRSKTISEISQERFLRRESENQANEPGKTASSNKAATKAIQTRLDNFVMPIDNRFHNEKTADLIPTARRNQPQTDNFLSQKPAITAASNLPPAPFSPQENRWADLPQSAESTDEYELSKLENQRLRRVEAEQTGGEWNE